MKKLKILFFLKNLEGVDKTDKKLFDRKKCSTKRETNLAVTSWANLYKPFPPVNYNFKLKAMEEFNSRRGCYSIWQA